jgi:hypothetical protein
VEFNADVIDLKLPWMTGYSRPVARAAAGCSARLGSDEATQAHIYTARLIHGIARHGSRLDKRAHGAMRCRQPKLQP